MRSTTVATFIAGVLVTSLGLAQEVEILSFGQNGDLAWSAPSGSVCTVEWSGRLAPTADWQNNWNGSRYIVMSNATETAKVPMFYRVVCWTNAAELGWRPARLEMDFDNDGTIDGVKRFSYDTDGNLVKEEEDEDNDGVVEFAKYYMVANGKTVKELGDDDYDGTINFVADNIYSNDLKIRVEYDRDNNGSIDKVNHKYYDSDSRLMRSEWDDDNDGTIDEINHFCRRFVRQGKELLSHLPQVKHTWSIDADEDHCILDIPEKCEGGFPVTVEVYPSIKIWMTIPIPTGNLCPFGGLNSFCGYVARARNQTRMHYTRDRQIVRYEC